MVAPRQYDVCRVKGLRADAPVDIAVLLQDDLLSDLPTRVVAPLVPVDEQYRVDQITPMVEIDGASYVVAMHLLATLHRRNLGQVIATLRDEEAALKKALDLVFFGV